ncbi:MAG: metallophosphoesterase [Oscillospiraceae bacterium]|nr:metallophosphoesterase [Oscillospiraceae bacterium]
MAIYAIGDLHLSVAAKKPMDIFDGWQDHAEKLIENWERKIGPQDTVVLAGDTSWGMDLAQAVPDFRLLHNLPGRKIILKGNHDYWWTSLSKMIDTLEKHELGSISFLHNNSYYVEGLHICGSRGWLFENGQPHNEKIVRREAMRIEASLKSRESGEGETILFLHYPPTYAGQTLEAYIDLMHKYGVKRCMYGHVHGQGQRHAVRGPYRGIEFSMIASDYLSFDPLQIKV